MGSLDPSQGLHLRLSYAVDAAAGSAANRGNQQGNGDKEGSDAVANADRGEIPAGNKDDAGAAAAAMVSSSKVGNVGPTLPTSSIESGAAPALHLDPLQVPGSNLSVHTVVMALLSGQLGSIVAQKEPLNLLEAFSAADRLPLGLVCLSSLPVSLPDEVHGGGIELDVSAASAVISYMLEAARGNSSL
jgi:hypothetical protein